MKKWYHPYRYGKVLPSWASELLDEFTEEEFNNILVENYPSQVYGRKPLTLMDAINLLIEDEKWN